MQYKSIEINKYKCTLTSKKKNIFYISLFKKIEGIEGDTIKERHSIKIDMNKRAKELIYSIKNIDNEVKNISSGDIVLNVDNNKKMDLMNIAYRYLKESEYYSN